MLFNSINFLAFFTGILTVYFLVPQKFKWLFLLLASYFFYGYWKKEYLLLLIFLTLEYFYKNKDRIVFWQRLPWQVKTAAPAFSCCLMIVFSVDSSNEFIYFQF